MTLALTFNTISLTLGNRFTSPFSETNYPRQRIEVPTFSRSFAGSVIAESIPYESPHTWTVGARFKQIDADRLKQIYSLWLLTRPFQYLILDDFIDFIYEPGVSLISRTRALAAGQIATLDGAGLKYKARFNALFVDPPEFAKDGAWITCQFQLIEGIKTTP